MECRRTAGLRPPSGDTAKNGSRERTAVHSDPYDLPQARVEWVTMLISRVRVTATSAGGLHQSPGQDPKRCRRCFADNGGTGEPPAPAATWGGPDEPTPQPCKRRSPGASGAPPNGGPTPREPCGPFFGPHGRSRKASGARRVIRIREKRMVLSAHFPVFAGRRFPSRRPTSPLSACT